MDDRDNHGEPRLTADAIATLGDRSLRPELEDRIVVALRGRGLLRDPATVPSEALPYRGRRRASWLVGAAAAGIAFWIGLQVGEMRAQRTLGRASAVVAAGRAEASAAEVRAAAHAYADALSRVRSGDLAGAAAAIEGVRTASTEIMRLAPESPLSMAMQIAFPTSFAVVPARTAPAARQPAVIWF